MSKRNPSPEAIGSMGDTPAADKQTDEEVPV
jgi:hypothetical protein